MTGDDDDLRCPCGAPIVCLICDACPKHCNSEGGPDACWESHEAWRERRDDASLRGTSSRPPSSIGPPPKPRWGS